MEYPPLPAKIQPGATTNLNARVPAELHFRLKWAALHDARLIADIVADLVTIYIEDPELISSMAARSRREGTSLGQSVVDALRRCAVEGR